MSQATGHRLSVRLAGLGAAIALTAGSAVLATLPAQAHGVSVGDVTPTARAKAKQVLSPRLAAHAKAKRLTSLPKAPKVALTDANRGDVATVASAQQGATITVSVGTAYAGKKVSVWLFSSPKLAYKGVADSAGLISAVLPVNARPGTHKVVVFSGRTLVGWTDLQVTAVPISNLKAPSIQGKVLTGYTVKAKPGTWTPAKVTLSYQWSLDGVDVAKATRKAYTVKLSDLGKALSVTVTASRKGTDPVSVTSAPVTVTQLTFTNVTVPTIQTKAFGSKSFKKAWFGHKSHIRCAFGGQVLQVTRGDWSVKGLTFRYAWSIDGQVVKTTKSPTYKPRTADVGKQLTVTVTATKKGYAPVSVTTAPVTIQAVKAPAVSTGR
ncbi:MAG: hypothetical protein VB036_12680 [Propionicimonas sp.]|nr:hypothetical protein [Propionicimonas sp.]